MYTWLWRGGQAESRFQEGVGLQGRICETGHMLWGGSAATQRAQWAPGIAKLKPGET